MMPARIGSLRRKSGLNEFGVLKMRSVLSSALILVFVIAAIAGELQDNGLSENG